MRLFSAFFFTAFFASVALAQDTTQQQAPVITQADTTSGWQLVFSNPKYSFGDLKFVTPDTGFIGAYNGTNNIFLRTTNAGLTWDSLPISVPSGVPYFITSQFWVSPDGNQNGVWKTTNGGQTWTPHDRKSIANGPVAFADNDTGVIFGFGQMARTTDAGETWREIYPPNDIGVNEASFANSKVGYGVGGNTGITGHPDWPAAAYCQKTVDGGATWEQFYTGGGLIGKDLYCCAVLDTATVIAGSSSIISRTLDGGITWIADTVLGYFEKISFANKRHGLIVGGDGSGSNPYGIIYSTVDTGKTWQKEYFPNGPELNGVQMLNDSIAIVCGRGKIYRTITSGFFSSVASTNFDFHLSIFPNPSSTTFTVQYELESASPISLRIFNIQGVMMTYQDLGIQGSGDNQTTIDASIYSNGAYYLGLSSGSNYQTISFIIQK